MLREALCSSVVTGRAVRDNDLIRALNRRLCAFVCVNYFLVNPSHQIRQGFAFPTKLIACVLMQKPLFTNLFLDQALHVNIPTEF